MLRVLVAIASSQRGNAIRRNVPRGNFVAEANRNAFCVALRRLWWNGGFYGACFRTVWRHVPRNFHSTLASTFLTTRKYSLERCQAGQRAAFFLPGAIQGSGTKQKTRCHFLRQSLSKVEVELKYFLSYMPVGVLTYPQLRRGMRRSVELGEPWPFVLAVIPSSNKRRKLFASRRKLFALPWLQSLATRRLRPV